MVRLAGSYVAKQAARPQVVVLELVPGTALE